MHEIHTLIQNARRHTRLNRDEFAALAGVSVERLTALEEAEAVPVSDELDSVARVIGVELDAFLRGEHGPNAVLFRTMRDEVELDDILASGDGLILGDFLRCVGRVRHVRTLLGQSLPEPTWLTTLKPVSIWSSGEPAYAQGVRLAIEARQTFGLDAYAPVPSMRRFLMEQGVEVFTLTPGRLQTPIDGVCTLTPGPAVLLNPLSEGAPWSQRTTMAHELCHLLHDRGKQPHMFLISPRNRVRRAPRRGRNRWDLFDGFLEIEQRANAFAAHFLAPEMSVRAMLDSSSFSPATPEAAQHVASSFGIGYETAVNIIWRAYSLNRTTRESLLRRAREHHTTFAYDEVPETRGLFTGQLQELGLEAYALGKLTRVEVRHLLELSMRDTLPQDRQGQLDAEQRRPVLSEEQVALKHATFRVQVLGEEQGRHLGVGELTRVGADWHITVIAFTPDGDVEPMGTLTLTPDYELKSTDLIR